MITVLHRGGGYAQMITILHGGGSLETPKSDYVICARPRSLVKKFAISQKLMQFYCCQLMVLQLKKYPKNLKNPKTIIFGCTSFFWECLCRKNICLKRKSRQNLFFFLSLFFQFLHSIIIFRYYFILFHTTLLYFRCASIS